MNSEDLKKILDEHQVYLSTFGECGSRANLSGAYLGGANLSGANLSGANLPDRTFIIFGEEYTVTITNGEYVRAGCKNHHIDAWRKFSKSEIEGIGGRRALKFFPRLLDIIDFYLGKGERPGWLN